MLVPTALVLGSVGPALVFLTFTNYALPTGGFGMAASAALGPVLLVFSAHCILTMFDAVWRLRAPWGEVRVGSDGIRWDGWVWGHFVPWSEVAGAVVRSGRAGRWLELARVAGRSVKIHAKDVTSLAAAIEEARAVYAAAEPKPPPAVLAATAEPQAWIERVRALGSVYREPTVPAEELVALVEDPGASALVRVGAVAALGARAQVARVRVAIEDLVDDELRRAMEAALDGKLSVGHVRALRARH